MEEIIQVQDQFYILATSSRIGEQNLVLKHNDTFAVFDVNGNVHRVGLGEQGIYHEGTRFLSRYDLRLFGRRPLLLSSTVRDDNGLLTVDLTNPDIYEDSQLLLTRDQVHLFRCRFLWQGVCYERLRLRSYAPEPVEVALTVIFEADFVDIFEVRGIERQRRGVLSEPDVEADQVRMRYEGLDGVLRETRLHFAPPPRDLNGARANFHTILPPRSEKSIYMTIACNPTGPHAELPSFDQALAAAAEETRAQGSHAITIQSSNERFNAWLDRSVADLRMMTTHTALGLYPYAGVPWFSTVFGRDALITALETLWAHPDLSRGVLAYLAAYQAEETDPLRDAEPGKILHEARSGEMATLGEIPFGCYYGSVDATPLFVMLAGAYYERTADREFLTQLWPHVERALAWIDQYGDADGDGFVEYRQLNPNGLSVQGWKDSTDSVFHADGTLAEGPVALCEVQGYVYAALRAASRMAHVLGHDEQGVALFRQARQLKERFQEVFWCEDLGTYALALDGNKLPCRVRSSNAGHCLYTGIASKKHAQRIARTLLDDHSFSGWGVRTVAATEWRYNPMSYHNGSIWPHDNALIVAGLSRYQLTSAMLKVFSGLFDASQFVDLHRMPELYCGFTRRPGEGPTRYPVACAPQSWAAAAVYSLVRSLLGISINAARHEVRFVRSVLPPSISRLQLSNLHVAGGCVDIALERYRSDVGIKRLRRTGDVKVVVRK